MLVPLRHDCAREPPGDMITKTDSHCMGLGRGLRVCNSNKFSMGAIGAQIINYLLQSKVYGASLGCIPTKRSDSRKGLLLQ